MVYSPADPTAVARWNPVVSLIATTVAPGTTAPEVSVTDPDMAPVPPWPNKAPVNTKTAVITRKHMLFTPFFDSAVSLALLARIIHQWGERINACFPGSRDRRFGRFGRILHFNWLNTPGQGRRCIGLIISKGWMCRIPLRGLPGACPGADP